MKKLLLLPLLVVPFIALYFLTANTVQAWTQEDCPTPQTHPDCLQYFPSPTPTVTPTPTATPTPKCSPSPSPSPSSTTEPTPTPTATPSDNPTPTPPIVSDTPKGDGPTGIQGTSLPTTGNDFWLVVIVGSLLAAGYYGWKYRKHLKT